MSEGREAPETNAAAWLDARRPRPPDELMRRMRTALAAVPDGGEPLPERLADAALDRLRTVLRSPADRSSAPELLAADALLTYAAEAAAEAGPAALDALLRSHGPDRIAALAADAGARDSAEEDG